jgi:hypothetical protein
MPDVDKFDCNERIVDDLRRLSMRTCRHRREEFDNIDRSAIVLNKFPIDIAHPFGIANAICQVVHLSREP